MMTELTCAVGFYIRDHPGCTSIQIASALKPRDSQVFGYQRHTSRAIAFLRAHGLVEDVGQRCETCRRALTRARRNVPLFLTPDGAATFKPAATPDGW